MTFLAWLDIHFTLTAIVETKSLVRYVHVNFEILAELAQIVSNVSAVW